MLSNGFQQFPAFPNRSSFALILIQWHPPFVSPQKILRLRSPWKIGKRSQHKFPMGSYVMAMVNV